MPVTAWIIPNSAAADTLASTAWTTPGNILADDGALVQESITAKNTPATSGSNDTGWLRCSYLSSQFSTIPAGATITLVRIRAEWHLTAAGSGIGILDLRWAVGATLGTPVHSNAAEPTVAGTVDTYDVTAERAWTAADFLTGDAFDIHVRGRNGNNAGNPGYRFDVVAVEVTYATGTDAPAEQASGTGTANAASVLLGTSAVEATATGTAFDAVIPPPDEFTWNNATAWNNAEVWYFAPTGTNAQAQTATGTGAAHAPSGSVAPSAGLATGTGTGQAPTIRVAPTPATAAAMGTANDATIGTTGGTQAAAQTADGTGTAFAPTSTISTTPPDLYTGEFQDSYGAPVGTGEAYAPSSRIAPSLTTATGTGVANNATVSIAGNTNAPAGLASGTGTAFNAVAQTGSFTNAQAQMGTGTGVANAPQLGIRTGPSTATATGTANNATVIRGKNAPAGFATATGAANNAAGSIKPTADLAAALGQAFDAQLIALTAGGSLGTSARTDAPTMTASARAAPELTGVAR